MVSAAFQSAIYVCLGALITLGGFVGCPCGHAESSASIETAVVATGHGCCAVPGAADAAEVPSEQGGHDSEPCSHCDGASWISECSGTDAVPVATHSIAFDGSFPSFTRPSRLAIEEQWFVDFSVFHAPAPGEPTYPGASLRTLSVLLTV